MRVWIAYVKDGEHVHNDPGMAAGMATVPWGREGDVIHAADDCPGECIFIEP